MRAGHPHPKRKLIRRLLLHGICLFEDKIKPPSAKHCSNGVAVKATNQVYCLTPHLFSQSLTSQALFTLKIRRARTQITIPCECLLGEGVLCTQAVKRTLIRSVLINGMCFFIDGTRAARRREKRASKLDDLYRPTVPFGCVAGAQSAVARLSADLYYQQPVCRSLLATN